MSMARPCGASPGAPSPRRDHAWRVAGTMEELRFAIGDALIEEPVVRAGGLEFSLRPRLSSASARYQPDLLHPQRVYYPPAPQDHGSQRVNAHHREWNPEPKTGS